MHEDETLRHPGTGAAGSRPRGLRLLGVAAAVLAVAVAARVSVPVPGSAVPQSLQTLAVVLAGGILGARRGAGAMVAYVSVGALGLPVFADGGAGLAHVLGPTAGYLVGFVAAAWLAGLGVGRRWYDRLWPAVGMMLAAHAVILLFGWSRLALLVGPGPAFAQGVAPFLAGGVVKSLPAGVLLRLWRLPGTVEPGPRGV